MISQSAFYAILSDFSNLCIVIHEHNNSNQTRARQDAFYISWLAANLDLLIEISKHFGTSGRFFNFDKICIFGKCGSPGSGANVTFVLFLGRILISLNSYQMFVQPLTLMFNHSFLSEQSWDNEGGAKAVHR